MALWEYDPSGLWAALGLLVFALGAWVQFGDATSAQNEGIEPAFREGRGWKITELRAHGIQDGSELVER